MKYVLSLVSIQHVIEDIKPSQSTDDFLNAYYSKLRSKTFYPAYDEAIVTPDNYGWMFLGTGFFFFDTQTDRDEFKKLMLDA